MSVRRLIKQNSSSNCVDECDNPTSLAYSHPIYDNQMDNKNIHTVAHRVESLPRTRKKVSLSRSHSFMDNSGLQRYVPPNRNMQSLHLEAAWTPSQSQSLQPVCLNRRMLVLVKQDNETFGFEIQTSRLQHLHPYTLEMCTYVCKVHEHSPAYHAGLAVGDILANVNGISTEGFSHTETVDLIKSSGNFLRVETLNGTIIRRSELEAKLHVLKKNLHEKWAELQSLLLQEQRLVHGKENDCSIDDSLELLEKGFSRSPSSLRSAFLNKHRFSSDSSCKSRLSSMTEDSEDGFYQMPVFDDSASETLSRQTSEDEECFFAKDSGAPPKNPSLTRNRSISLASSGSGPSSPLWDTCSLSNVFGTLPRKSRRGSVRRHILKFIPGLHKSVEEEESCV